MKILKRIIVGLCIVYTLYNGLLFVRSVLNTADQGPTPPERWSK